MEAHKARTFFGRRRGKGMSAAKDTLVASRMGEFEIKPGPGKIDFGQSFDFRPKRISFEIGYGSGEHLADFASARPDEAFIGAEAYENGNAALLRRIIDDGIKNVRIFPDDANLLFPNIPDASFDEVFLLYPDPWPKNRNEGRRMTSPEKLDILARILKPGGRLLVATDHPTFLAYTLMTTRGRHDLVWEARSSADFRNPPPGWTGTRYERKAEAEGRIPTYLSFRRAQFSKI